LDTSQPCDYFATFLPTGTCPQNKPTDLLRFIYTATKTQHFGIRLGHLVTKEFYPVFITGQPNAKASHFCLRVNKPLESDFRMRAKFCFFISKLISRHFKKYFTNSSPHLSRSAAKKEFKIFILLK